MNMDEAEQFEPLSVFSNQQMIEELTRRIGGPETVSINIFINSEGYLIEEKIRSAYPKEWIIDEKGPRCTAFEEEKT